MIEDALRTAHRAISLDSDPDGIEARAALLLAHRTADVASDEATTGQDRWTFTSLSIAEGIDRLVEGLPDELPPDIDVPDLAGDATNAVHEPLRMLLTSLSALYATAAGRHDGPPWRRLAWAAVTQHLDRALRELP
ncbi:hypothetical protein AB0C22_26485 [Micromonospora sp. NPDC048894]|uniref:hypothetical protein n=1 Tax=Micromonospora sp. NPDC048894 TaxID=3155493 RepID=UPI0033EE3D8C